MIRFKFQHLEQDTYTLELSYGRNHDAGVTGRFTRPFTSKLRTLLPHLLQPNIDLNALLVETQTLLQPLGDLNNLHQAIGRTLAEALLADEPIRTQFDAQLRLAGADRQPLRCQFLFGSNCEAVAALPWELLHGLRRLDAEGYQVSQTPCAANHFRPSSEISHTPRGEPFFINPLCTSLNRSHLTVVSQRG